MSTYTCDCPNLRRIERLRYDKLKALRERHPFKPFRIRLCSGQYVDVRRSDMLLLSRTLFMAGRRPTKEGIALGFLWNELIHIANITTLGMRKPRGRKKRSA